MDKPKTVTVSYDENLGIQTLKNIAPDLLPARGHSTVSGTHKSSNFITWLQKLDAKYPEQDTIRLVLDNHSAHTYFQRDPAVSCNKTEQV